MIYAFVYSHFSEFYYSPNTKSDYLSIIRINKIIRKRVTMGFLNSINKSRNMGKIPKREVWKIESIYQRIKDDNNYIKYKR